MGGRREKELYLIDYQLFARILNFINVYVVRCIGGLACWRIGALAFGLWSLADM